MRNLNHISERMGKMGYFYLGFTVAIVGLVVVPTVCKEVQKNAS